MRGHARVGQQPAAGGASTRIGDGRNGGAKRIATWGRKPLRERTKPRREEGGAPEGGSALLGGGCGAGKRGSRWEEGAALGAPGG